MTAVGPAPLDVLYDAPDVPGGDLPPALAARYGGRLGFAEPRLYANFVATVDGVVAIPDIPRSNALIADGSDGDRFVMGLLRAFADVVLIGAGTLHGSPHGTWTPARAYPAAASDFARLRRGAARRETPAVAIVSGGGSVDPAHPALEAGALVLTSEAAAPRLRRSLPRAACVIAVGDEPSLDLRRVLEALHARGHRQILSEAGPRVFGALAAAGLVDELFLTVSPLLLGSGGTASRLPLGAGADLLPRPLRGRLLSLRREHDHLFTRYALR